MAPEMTYRRLGRAGIRVSVLSFGSWVTYGLGSESEDLPGFVVMTSFAGRNPQPISQRMWGNGFLPGRFQGVEFNSTGDPVYYDILQSYMGYRTCYYRCFTIGYATQAMVDAYKRCRDYLDAAIELVRPGRTTGEIASVWPRAEEFGFANEEAAFALQYGHGVGLAIWEKPVISRLVSLDHPIEIQPGMVFALETFWPASDGWSAMPTPRESRSAFSHHIGYEAAGPVRSW